MTKKQNVKITLDSEIAWYLKGLKNQNAPAAIIERNEAVIQDFLSSLKLYIRMGYSNPDKIISYEEKPDQHE